MKTLFLNYMKETKALSFLLNSGYTDSQIYNSLIERKLSLRLINISTS